MTSRLASLFAPSKVHLHEARIEAYFKGDCIFPVTMELDLTQRCTRACDGCPYSAARRPGHTLSLPFLDRLFGILGANTPGLVVSGGEPTSVPHYPEVLRLARRKGFQEVSTITNGTCLDRPEVQDALLAFGTAVRVSLYDWQESEAPGFLRTLRCIEHLRRRADAEGSALGIGASILTRAEWIPRMEQVARAALGAGAHWVYFHPYCVDWEQDRPHVAGQSGVLAAIEAIRAELGPDANLQVPAARYQDYPLVFSELHAANFLLQVGADGVNYAGPECKYDSRYALLDLNEHLTDDFLWNPERLAKIRAIDHTRYRCIGTRHRPPMFSEYLEKIRLGSPGGSRPDRAGFIHPFII